MLLNTSWHCLWSLNTFTVTMKHLTVAKLQEDGITCLVFCWIFLYRKCTKVYIHFEKMKKKSFKKLCIKAKNKKKLACKCFTTRMTYSWITHLTIFLSILLFHALRGPLMQMQPKLLLDKCHAWPFQVSFVSCTIFVFCSLTQSHEGKLFSLDFINYLSYIILWPCYGHNKDSQHFHIRNLNWRL